MNEVAILARGLGMRMRRENPTVDLDTAQERIAATGVKALIPIERLKRPFLDYVLTAVAAAGYDRVCLVIGPEHCELRRYYGEELHCERLQIDFAVQEEPRGTADAVVAVEDFAAGEPFLMLNSDNYYPVEALAALRTLDEKGLAVFGRAGMLAGSNIPPQRLSKFAVVETGEDGYMRRIVEKPDPAVLERLPDPVGLSMNCWRFDADIFPACRAIEPSPRGELEIPAAVQYAIDTLGQSFRALHFEAAVLDLSSREDVGPVAALLQDMEVCL